VRIVAAMSGGVDSSVVAGLLVEAGHEVIGVHMKLHDVEEGEAGHCCGLDDAMDARRVADRLNIPFYVMDLRQAFQAAVMDDFAKEYLAGRTPNPCIRCNGVLKFKVLLSRAKALGASHLATGHYARIDDDGGLMRAVDVAKDQSYFLFPVTRTALRQTLFPLGGMTKPEVRQHAERMGLVTANKPESQEVCFIPDDDHTRFVREHTGTAEGAGEIVDEHGKVLGHHDGYFRFTIGQRRGLGIAMGTPVYVLDIDAISHQVTIGPSERLLRQGLVATDMNWFREPGADEAIHARIRHRGGLLSAEIEGHDPCRVRFDAPAHAIAAGQGVVLYAGDEVLGGGWIREAFA
jgi:tRNA-specific 2-thiouridylase